MKAFKYQGLVDIGVMFGEEMCLSLDVKSFDQHWLCVPVPLYWRRNNERGFNQSREIAKVFAQRLSIHIEPKALSRVKATSRQVGLSKKERQKNLHGAFRVKNPELVQGKRILLVDDVATTLTTLDMCAQELLRAGALEVHAACAARAGNAPQQTKRDS